MNRFSLYLLLTLSFFLTEFSYGQDEELSFVLLLSGSQVLVLGEEYGRGRRSVERVDGQALTRFNELTETRQHGPVSRIVQSVLELYTG
jgi:hypothetical protein